ncbi:MAG TPA: hypothetical protein VFL12_09440, partial [Thermoanaerobaculia bacterium]|nr:hypothetical protein [Thermoanaerobaculia bacterium]
RRGAGASSTEAIESDRAAEEGRRGRLGAGAAATYEFHAPHSGHRPIHFGDAAPHSEQEKPESFFTRALRRNRVLLPLPWHPDHR